MGFNTPYLNTKHASAKLACLLMGVIVSFSSYFAYSDSPWYSENLAHICSYGHLDNLKMRWSTPAVGISYEMETAVCPSLIMERFFVYSNIVICGITFLLFLSACTADIYTLNDIRNRDAAFHVAAGVVIVIGAILQIASCQQLESNKCKMTDNIQNHVQSHAKTCGRYFNHDSKYVAAGLGFASAVAYVATACVIEQVKLHGLDLPRRNMEAGPSHDDFPRVPLSSSRRSSAASAALIKMGAAQKRTTKGMIGNRKPGGEPHPSSLTS